MVKVFLKDIGIYFPSQITPAIVAIVSIPIITRLFLPGDYGNYSLVIAAVSILSTLVGWLSMVIIRFYPAYELNRNIEEFYATVIILAIISIVVVSFIVLIGLIAFGSYIPSQLYALMLIGILMFGLTSFFGVLQQFLRASRQAALYCGFSIWRSVTMIGFGLLLVFFLGFGIDGLLWGSIISLAVIFPFLWKKAVGTVSLQPRRISVPVVTEMAKYSFPLVIGNLATWILSLSDRFVLEFFRGSQEVGIYSASYRISENSIMLLASLFLLAERPILMHTWESEGEEKSKTLVSKVTRYYIISCIPGVVGLSVLAKPIVKILTGAEYLLGYQVIPFVTMGAFIFGLQQRFQMGPLFFKRTRTIMSSIITASILNLALNFLLVPRYGYMAAAFTTLISYAFLLLLMVLLSRQFFAWSFPFSSLAKVCVSSAAMGLVMYYIGNGLTSSVPINLTLAVCAGSLVYFVILFLLSEFQQNEIRELLALRTRNFERENETGKR